MLERVASDWLACSSCCPGRTVWLGRGRPREHADSARIARRHIARGLFRAVAKQEFLHLQLEQRAMLAIERRKTVTYEIFNAFKGCP